MTTETQTLADLSRQPLPDVPASTAYDVAREIVDARGFYTKPPFTRVQMDSPGLGELFAWFAQLGLGVPGALVVELAHNMTLYRRLAELRQAPPRDFGTGDLDADDYADRYAAIVAQRERQTSAETLLEPAMDQLNGSTHLLIEQHLPNLVRTLSALYEANADDLNHLSRLSGAERDRLTPLAEPLYRAHDRLLAWGPTLPGYHWDVAANWCTYWEFSMPAWIRLVQRTKALETKPDEDGYALAVECGGRPRLAVSQRQAMQDAHRLQRGFKVWKDNGGDRVRKTARKLTTDELDQVLAGESIREQFRQRDADLLSEAHAREATKP